MQFYNSFPGMYLAKSKDILRKNGVSEKIVKSYLERWKTEAEAFRKIWLSVVEAKLEQGETLDRTYKRKVPSGVPVVKEQSIQNFFKSILDNISPRPIKEQKSYLEEIIKPFIPQWNEVIQKDFVLYKF